MQAAVKLGSLPLAMGLTQTKKCRSFRVLTGTVKLVPGLVVGFYPFFTRRLRKIKYPFARTLAWRMERLPVQAFLTPIPSLSIRAFCTKPNETMADKAVQVQNLDSISYLTQREAAEIDEILMGPLGFSIDQLMVKLNHSLIHNPILLCLFVVFTFSI
ncbi:uncharacterized protein LOC126690079 [Quercus robur]|uniref:uncharacterized protein LOC126690079 n=1 Tax=Quercus robur TaxID=38942 RepID=UPI002163D2E0|nr:uncharacterized protein LOC126690079 [Quercus robur]